MTQVFPVLTKDVQRYWSMVSGFLYPAVETSGGRWELEDVLTDLRTGASQLWMIVEGQEIYGVGVTKIHTYPRAKVLNCVWIGGVDARLWMDELNHVVGAWAAEQGCDRLEFVGRKGWEKMGAALGFVPRFVMFERLITEEDRHGSRLNDEHRATSHVD